MEEVLRRQGKKLTRGNLSIEEDSEFHYIIARASENTLALKVLDFLMDLLLEVREGSLKVKGRPEKSFAGHQRILANISRHHPAAAAAAMRRHIQEIEDNLLHKI